jgi:LCP family protein required for cell wall assembly
MNQQQPADPWSETQPTQTPYQPEERLAWAEPKRKRPCCSGCFLAVITPFILLAGILLIYLLFPGRTNILVFGLDSRDPDSLLGRTDTIILTTIEPWQPYTGMLSIPRDLWVDIPQYGENRINAAYFFAEADQPGSGPEAIMQTISASFGVDVDYYVRIRFIGFLSVVDALGGIEVELPRAMSGYPAGVHQLDAELALALVRDRAGSDDFSRMERGQLFIKAVLKHLLSPEAMTNIPQTLDAFSSFIETDIPIWLWPRLAFALLRLGPEGLDARIITREMTNPFTTSGGAQVLAPNWELINPVLMEIFGQ